MQRWNEGLLARDKSLSCSIPVTSQAVFPLSLTKNATKYAWDPNPSMQITTLNTERIKPHITIQTDKYTSQSISSKGTPEFQSH